MSKNLVIFEDNKFSNLYPLVYFRPVFELKCGTSTLSDRITRFYNADNSHYYMREYLKELFSTEKKNNNVNNAPSDQTLYLNGRILAERNISELIPFNGQNEVFYSGEEIVAIRSDENFTHHDFLSGSFNEKVEELPKTEIPVLVINYCWDLIYYNEKILRQDFEELYGSGNKSQLVEGVYLINQKNIYIGNNVTIKPTVVLDGENGPIIIEDNVTIRSHSTIEGPAFIGKNSVVKSHTNLYDSSSIGEWCKIGGEVENSILHSFSNKQHEGFLGHSYLGQWVNIGASTITSDLKNNYSNVSVYVGNKLMDTGYKFVGMFMGDHSKTAINTIFNTGTIVGPACNIFGSGFPARNIPAFTFGGVEKNDINRIDKALETAHLSMKRRNVEFSDEHYKVFEYVYKLTEKERQKL